MNRGNGIESAARCRSNDYATSARRARVKSSRETAAQNKASPEAARVPSAPRNPRAEISLAGSGCDLGRRGSTSGAAGLAPQAYASGTSYHATA